MLLWFRNDLRVNDNPALDFFLQHRQPQDKAIVFLLKKQWRMFNWADIKVDFIYRHIELLQQQLSAINVELDIVELDDFAAQIDFFTSHHLNKDIQIIANQELELNERSRDHALVQLGFSLTLFECDVVVPKGALTTQSGEMYKVFTPFKRAWLNYVRQYGISLATLHANAVEDDINTANNPRIYSGRSSGWPLVNELERSVVPSFFQCKLSEYAAQRDIPSVKGTSGFSPYFATGTLSARVITQQLLMKYPDLLIATDSAEFSWLNELIWRDFYRHILHFRQDLCKHNSFNVKYENMPWPDRHQYYKTWCEGKTGYPLVDAAMQQLNQTGWMHNRLRMIVASFLTKHLLVDWRLGERYFMEKLIDGDFAANNGGWQWAASTGCDAQPYFRVFNPIRQSERFDPNGCFIRKYLPELADIPNKHIHFPHQYMSEHNIKGYWPAIVEHKPAREQALAFYRR